jgi:hypothetical protein
MHPGYTLSSRPWDELGLEDAERPEVDHDTKDTLGMAEITKTILDKISKAAVFVADVTPIGKAESGKALLNPNVMIELGWALKEVGPDRIIAVLKQRVAGSLTTCLSIFVTGAPLHMNSRNG